MHQNAGRLQRVLTENVVMISFWQIWENYPLSEYVKVVWDQCSFFKEYI